MKHRVGRGHGVSVAVERAPLVPPRLRLRLFDGWRLTQGSVNMHIAVRGQRLVALLALRGPLTRGLVGGILWPEADEHRAQTSVRATLWALHQQVPGLIEAPGGEMMLAGNVSVDVDEFLAHARGLLHLGERAAPDTSMTGAPANGWLGGELLPGWCDDWVIVERERLHQLRLHALEALTDRLIGLGDHAGALEIALTAVAIDPLRESAHRSVMRAHVAEGNTAEALRQYERFRVLLRESMGIEPSRQIIELVQQICTEPAANHHPVLARPARLNGTAATAPPFPPI